MRLLKRWLVGLAVALATVGFSPDVTQAQASQASLSASCPSLGCYSYATMQPFYNHVINLVDQFSTASLSAMPRPKAYYFIKSGGTMQSGCGPATATAFQECDLDDSIYVGQDQLWSFYSDDGDVAGAFGVGHEWGHHIQLVTGISKTKHTPNDQIQAENQADCIGGAFVQYLENRGITQSTDLGAVDRLLTKIGDAEGPQRTHGTVQQRFAATQYGIDHGLAGCSIFFPGVPLPT